MDLARAPRRAARKKGSGYENGDDPIRIIGYKAWFPNGRNGRNDQPKYNILELKICGVIITGE